MRFKEVQRSLSILHTSSHPDANRIDEVKCLFRRADEPDAKTFEDDAIANSLRLILSNNIALEMSLRVGCLGSFVSLTDDETNV